MKHVLVDVYLAENLGDDMFLDHLVKYFPHIRFTPFHPGRNYKDFFKQYNNVHQFPYTIFDKISRKLGKNILTDYERLAQKYDALIFLGGGIFREESYWKELWEYRMQISTAFRENAKSVFFIGCNFGPFRSEVFVNAHKELFRIADHISFRDVTSYKLFKELSNVQYAPDLLWSYPIPCVKPEENTVGISVIDPRHKEGLQKTYSLYIETHKKLVRKLLEEGKKVKIFAFCEKEGDSDVAKSLAEIQSEAIEIFIYKKNIVEYLKEFATCQCFIGARFHAVILALKFNIPVIPVIYGDKLENLLKDLAYPEKFIYLENIYDIFTMRCWQLDKELIQQLSIDGIKHLASLK